MGTKKTGAKESASVSNPGSSELIKNATFALDIGTRSVVGILGVNENGTYHVLDYEQKFHTERAMRDGQIEDIDLVADVVKQVKTTLEKRHRMKLTSVSIAAAGRALKTKRVCYEQSIDPDEEITQKLLQAMEYCAVGMSQEEFISDAALTEEERSSFYCVGYSVISYHLDNYPISTLMGHKGKKVSIELIAAFLPHNVVQSLYTVMRINELSVENLTLEPIAAINVIVPKDIRLLNIALVDIGAGTSDIAISKNGSIVAYDMVTTAGDEITETIMQKYLTDFETAEKIKLALGAEENEITFSDIMGNTCTETKSKIIKNIKESIQSLSESISNRILQVNEVPPLAVFLVGGGSQIPELCRLLAQQLNISQNYVSIGGKKPFKNITLFTEKLQSPEFITPIGIGTLTSLYQGCDFFSITVNGKKQMLLNYGNTKVLDALLLSSVKPQNLIGISPRSVIFYINGEKMVRRGKASIPGELYINGAPASIDTQINQGDEIVVKPAIDGARPNVTIEELKQSAPHLHIIVDDIELSIEPEFSIDDQILSNEYVIRSLDAIKMRLPATIGELFHSISFVLSKEQTEITLNGQPADENTPIASGDIIDTTKKADTPQNDSDTEQNQTNEPYDLYGDGFSVCINGTWTDVTPNEKNQVFFFDMLNYVDIDTKNPQGNIILKQNGQDASYTSLISKGDTVEIRWEKEQNTV